MKKVYLFICLLLAGMVVQAQVTKTWVSNVLPASPNNWNDATSWSPSGVPASNDIVIFSNTKNDTVTLQTSVSCGSISVQGTSNIVLRSSGGVYTVALGATAPALNINASRSLTLIGTAASQGTVLSIPTGGTATINGSLNIAPFNNAIATQQSQLLSVDAGSVVVNSGATVLLGPSNSVAPFGTTSVANDIVLFKSGSKFTAYSTTSPWGSGMTAPNQIVSFQQGSTYQLFGGTGFPSIAGRTLGTLQLSGGNNGSISNATAVTTTILDSLIITAASSTAVTFLRGTGGSALPTFSFNNIRISATGSSATPVVFSNNGFDNASFVISGGVIVNTASAAAGNASLTLGNTAANTSNTSTSITFTGSGKTITTEDQGAGAGVPSIVFNSPASVNTGNKTTSLIIDSTASINLNANLDLTTINSGISNLTVRAGSSLTGSLTIMPNRTLIVGSGGKLTTAGSVTLQSDATGTGSIGNSAGTIIGNVIVQRYIPGNNAWRTLGFPFTAATNITGVAGNTGLSAFVTSPASAYWYNEAADNGIYGTGGASVNAGWTAFTSGTSVSATNGILLWGGATAQTVSMTGAINTGAQSIGLTKSAAGWNLVANPYPSNILFSSIVTNNPALLNGNTVYRVNPLGNGAYSFSSYSTGTGTGSNGGSNVIENGASFFVQAANAGNLAIAESDKTTSSVGSTSGGVSLLGANDNSNSIRLTLKGGEYQYSDEVVFMWDKSNKATDGFDPLYDAYDLGTYKTHDLSILDQSGTRYSIFNGSSLSNSIGSRIYKLGLQSLQAGHYELGASMQTQLNGNNEAVIVDNYLHTTTLLKDGLVYGFDVTSESSSKVDGRFQLMINKKTSSNIAIDANNNNTYLVANPSKNSQIAIRFGKNAQSVNWTLIDLNGKEIGRGVLNNVSQGATKSITVQSLQSGTYLIRLSNDNDPAILLKWIKL